MKVARAAAEFLVGSGVRRVYGLPGEDHLHLLSAFAEAGLEYVLARNESAACIMAGVEAQTSGAPGVAVVSYAPGLTNAINGLANAYLDHLPLLVLSGQFARARYALTIRQAMDNHRIVAPVTKWSVAAGPAIHQTLARAVATAMAEPRGPVFVELPQEIAEAEATDASAPWRSGLPAVRAASPLAGAEADGGPLAQALATARRPVVVAGGRRYDAAEREALACFAARRGAPTFLTAQATGALPSDDEWCAGAFMNGNLESGLLGKADLIVAVNLAAGDIFNRPWPYQAPTVALNDTADTERFFPRAAELCGDVGAVLRSAAGPASASAWSPGDVRRYRDDVRRTLRADVPELTVGSATIRARRELPRDASIVVDAGFSKVHIAMLWDALCADGFWASHGLSTMGYAIPAANALQLARRDRTVVAFTGDGSLLMRAPEISVAADLGIAPVYVAWMDAAMTQIEVKQRRMGLRAVGVALPELSAERIAAAFGGCGRDVRTLDEFGSALREAVAARIPTLIGAHIDTASTAELYDAVRG